MIISCLATEITRIRYSYKTRFLSTFLTVELDASIIEIMPLLLRLGVIMHLRVRNILSSLALLALLVGFGQTTGFGTVGALAGQPSVAAAQVADAPGAATSSFAVRWAFYVTYNGN